MKKQIFLLDNRRNRRKAARDLKKNKPQSETIILMSIPLAVHTITAVLDMPKGNAERGARAKDITDACEVSTYVSVPAGTIATVRADTTAYNGATSATRPNLWRVLHNDMKALMRMFQDAADADPANAIAIIESGAFKVKQVAIPQKHEFTATNNAVSGTIDLIAPGGPTRSCHDWKYSADGLNFVRMTPTIAAETHKDGLTPGRFAWFTHELITKDGPQGISQVIKIEVK